MDEGSGLLNDTLTIEIDGIAEPTLFVQLSMQGGIIVVNWYHEHVIVVIGVTSQFSHFCELTVENLFCLLIFH